MNVLAKIRPGANLEGEAYQETLARLHRMLRPKTYLEIGVCTGESLAHATCPSIAIDPELKIDPEILARVFAKPAVLFYQMGSDDFFARWSPAALLGAPIDMAFLDGMHRCEYLLRDFINTEKFTKRNSIVALHDCLPVEAGIANRGFFDQREVLPEHKDWWAGDVWRTALLLRRHRPDLRMTTLDAFPTGLVLITNLDPASTTLADNYTGFVEEMLSWELNAIGIANLFAEMAVESTASVQTMRTSAANSGSNRLDQDCF